MIEQLMEAARSGDTDTLQMLLEKHPDQVNARMPSGEGPLIAALYYGKQRAVQCLLDLGVSVTIHEAAALGDDETIAYMLDLEPRLISEISFDGWTPLHLACFFGGYEAAQLLIDRGADIHVRSTNNMANTPLHAAAASKRTALVLLLLERGADPNAQQRGGWTALHQAVNNYDSGMAELLLKFGADPLIVEDGGHTAAQLAAHKGYSEIAALLDGDSR